MLNANKANVYTDFNGLANLKTQARQKSPEALKEVAKQFESIFLGMVLKGMRDAKLADGIMDSDQSRFFRDMYDKQLSIHLAGDPGVGLAELIVKQLSPDQSLAIEKNKGIDAYRSHPVITNKLVQKTSATDAPEIEAAVKNNRSSSLKAGKELPITSIEQFVKQLWPYAEQAGNELGVDPKILLAQTALETGWGGSVIKQADGSSSHNLFNIKADKSWQGQPASVNTLEYEQGVKITKRMGFRTYSSYQESFQDYVQFVKTNPRYGKALQHVGKGEQYIQELGKAGYATDPQYADKVIKIYQGKTIAKYAPEQKMAMNFAANVQGNLQRQVKY
jgi:peptidoglycan hydrolase FlgJ